MFFFGILGFKRNNARC